MELNAVRDTIIKSFEGKDRLNRRIWREEKLKPVVRRRLLTIAEDFIEFLKVKLKIDDIILTGSMANYDWSEFSDLDVHIITDFDSVGEKDLVQEFFNTKKFSWNDLHNIKLYGYDVELYVEDKDDKVVAGGIYSLKKDEWIKKPKPEERSVSEKAIKAKAQPFMSQIDDLVLSAKYPNERLLTRIDEVKDQIRLMRTTGLSAHGEQSIENLAFKYLRRNGYLEKLMNLKIKAYDRLRSF